MRFMPKMQQQDRESWGWTQWGKTGESSQIRQLRGKSDGITMSRFHGLDYKMASWVTRATHGS